MLEQSTVVGKRDVKTDWVKGTFRPAPARRHAQDRLL